MRNNLRDQKCERDAGETNVALFVYSFSVWPDETWQFDRAMFQLFEMFKSRLEMTFPQEEFERFRSGLSNHGLTLREVERVPYYEPEPVP